MKKSCTVHKTVKASLVSLSTYQQMASRGSFHQPYQKRQNKADNKDGKQYRNDKPSSANGDYRTSNSNNFGRGSGNGIGRGWTDRNDQQSSRFSCSSDANRPTRAGWEDHKNQQSSGYSWSPDVNNTTRFGGSSSRYEGGNSSRNGGGSSTRNDSRNPRDSKKNKLQGPEGGASLSMGIPINQLKRAPECFKEKEKSLNELMGSPDDTVLCSLESAGITQSSSRPADADYSNEDHISMPYTVLDKHSEKGIPFNRWERFKSALQLDIGNCYALEKTICSYSDQPLKFNVLHQYFEVIDVQKACFFFEDTLPKIVELALRLPDLCPEALPFLKQKSNMKITLSQEQVACLLANAFFCTFPPKNNKQKGGGVPEINFNTLYSDHYSSHRKIEKLKCIINYFERVTNSVPCGRVTYKRQFVTTEPGFWFKMEKRLTDLHVSTDGTIEDVGKGMLQADFANKFVGGGVLTNGLVQEEIRFVLCPEMILSRLFTEMLTSNEALIMTGCERFSDYTGYSDTFLFKGNHEDKTERDKWSRRYTEVTAMDALVFHDSYNSQFEKSNLLRELSKAFCAFKGSELDTDLPAVCTGNWGCGAFGGDKQLKAMIQMMAASASGRDVCYLTFGDTELCQQFGHIHQILKGTDWSINNIVSMVQDYGTKLNSKETKQSLFEFIEKRVSCVRKIPHINAMRNDNRKGENCHENKKKENYHGNRSVEENIHENRSQRENVHEDQSREENVNENNSGETVHENRNRRENVHEDQSKEEHFHRNKMGETVHDNKGGEEHFHGNKRGETVHKSEEHFHGNRRGETVNDNKSEEEHFHGNKRGETVHDNKGGEENLQGNKKGETVHDNKGGEENLQGNKRGETVHDKGGEENLQGNREGESSSSKKSSAKTSKRPNKKLRNKNK